MRIEDPSGQRWLVRRRWRTEHLGRDRHGQRFVRRSGEGLRRSRAGEWADVVQLGDLGDIPVVGVIFAVIAVLAGVVLAVLFVVPFLFALGELLVLILLGAAGILGKIVFRRPWTIEAVNKVGTNYRWQVPGWRASSAVRRFVADHLRATGQPPGDAEVEAAAVAG